jgi:hypothetical protein
MLYAHEKMVIIAMREEAKKLESMSFVLRDPTLPAKLREAADLLSDPDLEDLAHILLDPPGSNCAIVKWSRPGSAAAPWER